MAEAPADMIRPTAWFEEYRCGCVSAQVRTKRELPGLCGTHGDQRRHARPVWTLRPRRNAKPKVPKVIPREYHINYNVGELPLPVRYALARLLALPGEISKARVGKRMYWRMYMRKMLVEHETHYEIAPVWRKAYDDWFNRRT